MKIPEFELEGTTEEIAEQVFQKLIYPIYNELKKTDPVLAKRFGYCVSGNAIASYLNAHRDLKQAEKLIIDSTKSMAADIKLSRKKIC